MNEHMNKIVARKYAGFYELKLLQYSTIFSIGHSLFLMYANCLLIYHAYVLNNSAW